MKKIFFILLLQLFISCNKSNDEIKNSSKKEQVEFLEQKFNLNSTTLNELTEEQFKELLDLHLDGVFDKKNLIDSWREYANLNDEQSKIYIKENFNNVKDINIILSFY